MIHLMRPQKTIIILNYFSKLKEPIGKLLQLIKYNIKVDSLRVFLKVLNLF